LSPAKKLVALVVLVVAAYLPVLSAGYIWDDDKHLTENVCIVGPAGFAGIWTTSEATYYPLVLTTFWVEHGKVVAPVDVLRFDDTLYRLLGDSLEALTQETEFILDAGTYQSRQLASVRLPGALVSEMAFTL